jgi:HEAT repeat protein
MNPTLRKRFWWGLWLLVLLTIGIIVALNDSKPKLHQGRTVHEWVSRLDSHVDYQKQRDEASWALVQIGAEALPELENILAWRNSGWEDLRNYAVHYRILKRRPVHPLELQSRACEAAYNLAERANVDISRLVAQLSYHFTNGTYADSNSGRALAAAGPAGIAVLTNLVLTGKQSIRDHAGWALHHVKKRPEVIAALLIAATTGPDNVIRANALSYLQGCGGPAEQVVPVGLKFLKNGDGYDRWNAVLLLRDYLSVQEVRGALEIAATDSDPRVQSAAESALKNPGQGANRK